MKIGFVHYHLKTGGVTTVLKQQIEAIQSSCDVLTITGEAPARPFPGPVACVPGLGYDRPGTSPFNPEAVADAVVSTIRQQWPGGCDLLHIHNPLLAKNRQFLKILAALQQRGLTLLLQIHDMAEDGRPSAYFKDAYPADCHYAVINSRDFHLLRQAGLQNNGIHLLYNNIDPLPHKASRWSQKPCVLYPIRAIRRKNIGEAILVSLFLKGDETLAITLPPHSAADMPSYSRWKGLVADNQLRVLFDVGQRHDFGELVGAARFLITTSITEGFGFSFLEPWPAGKVLWGRSLPDICRDFESNGVDLGHLYTRLAIPLKWIDHDLFCAHWRTAVADACALFDHPLAARRIDRALERISADQTIDFGLLHEKFQQEVIARVVAHKPSSEALIAHNPFLGHPGQVPNAQGLVAKNRAAVLEHYAGRGYTDRLLKTYRHVAGTPVKQHIDKSMLIDQFLDLNTFSLLKWKPYA